MNGGNICQFPWQIRFVLTYFLILSHCSTSKDILRDNSTTCFASNNNKSVYSLFVKRISDLLQSHTNLGISDKICN